MADEEAYLALSGIQHFYYCKRQWALIHIERQWAENARTFGGSLMHKNADDPFFTESRGRILLSRSLPLCSHRLEAQGVADVVEFHRVEEGGVALRGREGLWRPVPVEYKYGQPKEDEVDIVQLTAQAICLEEMFKTQVPRGYLYYGKTRQRVSVECTAQRRQLVEQLCEEMRQLRRAGETPLAEYRKSCKNCSLYELCLPQLSKRRRLLKTYLKKAIADTEME